MEFPELGKHCSVSSCKQLDFLPVRCDACRKTFCKEHFTYESHSCSESYKKDNQVPVCPLCNVPIPLLKGESADVKVGKHIDSDCQSDPAKEKRKVYKNKCSVKGCKQKELVPVTCEKCRKNYCLKHRHETDHQCTGFQNSGRGVSSSGAAAVRRQAGTSSNTGPFKTTNTRPQHTQMSNTGRDLDRERRERWMQQNPQLRSMNLQQAVQGGMSEDEAIAQAMRLSMQDAQGTSTSQSQNTNPQNPEEADLALARALQESEREALRRRRQPQQSSAKDKCEVS